MNGTMHRTRPVTIACRVGVLASIAVSALGVSACGSSGSAPASAPPSPLRVGVSLSLTGTFADPGRAALRGYQLWTDKVNTAGGILGRQVQLTVLDDRSTPSGAVSDYRRLITREKVDLVLGPFSSLLTEPSAMVAKQYRYAFIEPAGGGPNVFAPKFGNLFFVQQAPAVKEGAVFADYVLSLPRKQRPKTAAYTELDDPFAAPIAEYIRSRLEAAGVKTVYRRTYGAQTPLGPIIARTAAARPDIIVSGTQSDDAYAEVSALVRLRFKPRLLFMSNGANSPTEFPDKVGADHVNGIMTSGDWFPDTSSLADADFVRSYIAKYGGTGQNIDATSAESYSAGMLLQDIARRTGKIDNATIVRSLHSGSWPTLVGNLSWNAIGEPQGSYTLVQWIDGQLIPVFPAGRAQHHPVIR